jgi:hypothetical protein
MIEIGPMLLMVLGLVLAAGDLLARHGAAEPAHERR